MLQNKSRFDLPNLLSAAGEFLHILHGRGEIRLKNESTPWGRNLDTNAMKQMLLRSKYLDIHIFLPIVSQLLLWTAVWVVQQHNKASFKATAFLKKTH